MWFAVVAFAEGSCAFKLRDLVFFTWELHRILLFAYYGYREKMIFAAVSVCSQGMLNVKIKLQ